MLNAGTIAIRLAVAMKINTPPGASKTSSGPELSPRPKTSHTCPSLKYQGDNLEILDAYSPQKSRVTVAVRYASAFFNR